MTEPPRFSDGDPQALGSALFRALRVDKPPDDLEARTLAQLGLPLLPPGLPSDGGASLEAAAKGAGAAGAGASTAGVTAGASIVSAVFAKYFVAGALVAGVAVGGATVVNDRVTAPLRGVATTTARDGQANVRIAPVAASPVDDRAAATNEPVPVPSARAVAVVPESGGVPRDRPIAPSPGVPPPAVPAPPTTKLLVPPAATAAVLAPSLLVPGAAIPGVAPAATAAAEASAERFPLPLQQELAALDLARSALARGDATATLRAIEAYRSTFRRGQLGREATVIEIEARLRLGDRANAERLGRGFLQTSADSPLAPRVRALLGWTEGRTIP